MLTENTPLISIISSVYNVELYLHQCIESVINQTFQEWELLLVDDGSTDGSGKICDDYAQKDARIHVIHKKNTGLADSRNVALNMARGKFIGFIDSDDWIDAEMYQTLYSTMMKYSVDIVVCGFSLDYKDRIKPKCASGETIIYTRDEAFELILEDKVIQSYVWNKLCRKEVINTLFPVSFYYEDYPTVFKWFYQAKGVALVQHPFYHYRQRTSSIVHDIDPKKEFHFVLAAWERYQYLESHHIFPERKQEFAELFVRLSLSSAKKIARSSANKELVMKYVGKIQTLISPLFLTVYQDLRPKDKRRFSLLNSSLSRYILLMRFKAMFLLKKKCKEGIYFE